MSPGNLGGRIVGTRAAPALIERKQAQIIADLTPPTDFSWDFDATDAGTLTSDANGVSLWENRAGAAMDFQKQGAFGPITGSRTIGGLNALDFTAGGARLMAATSALTVAQPLTFYVVCEPDSDAGGNLLENTTTGARFGIQTTDTGNLHAGSTLTTSGFTDGAPHVVSVFLDGTDSGIRVDDGAIVAGDAGTLSLFAGSGGPYVGGFLTAWWDGLIGKILGWDRHLSDFDDGLVLADLMSTWGI